MSKKLPENLKEALEFIVETITVKSYPRKKRLSREEFPNSVEHKSVVIDLDDKKYPECGEEEEK